jgi:hydroxypyruvate isomerase
MAKNICINIEPFFTDLPYVERIKRVRAIGFSAIEMWIYNRTFDGTQLTPEAKDIGAISKVAKELHLDIGTFNINSRDGTNGGALITRGHQKTFEGRVREGISIAKQLNCKNMTILTGHCVEHLSHDRQKKSIIKGLEDILKIVEGQEITLLLEALNTSVDHPGYFLDSIDEAADIVKSIGHKHLKLLFDVYHIQVMSGNILQRIEKYLDLIGHIHFAGVPGRHEIFEGELNYLHILRFIEGLNYGEWVGLEYFPRLGSEESLMKTREYLQQGGFFE